MSWIRKNRVTKNVKLVRQDWKKTASQYDKPGNCFVFDPPWGKECKYFGKVNGCDKKEELVVAVADKARKMKSKVMITVGTDYRATVCGKGLRCTVVSAPAYGIKRGDGSQAMTKVLVARNY